MPKKIPAFVLGTVAILVVLAIAFAIGGRMVEDRLYPLYGAVALICLLLALLLSMVLDGFVSCVERAGLAAGRGSLMAVCGGLYFLPGLGIWEWLGFIALGAFAGLVYPGAQPRIRRRW